MSHLSSKNVNICWLKVKICCFSLFAISLGFGLLVQQNQIFEDTTLGNRNLRRAFHIIFSLQSKLENHQINQ